MWLLPVLVSYVLPTLRCSGGLSNQQIFWKENGFLACFLATNSCYSNFEMYPSSQLTKSVRHHDDPIPTSCFVTGWSAGALFERFEYRFGYRSARALSLPIICARNWSNSLPRSTKARLGSKTRYCIALAAPACMRCLRLLPAIRCMDFGI